MPRPKKNNADYFSHDNDMRNHRKIKAVRAKFWIEWYAVWNMMLEYLCDCDFFECKIDDIEREILAGDFDVNCDRLKQIVTYCVSIGLFQNNWDRYWSEWLKERLQPVLDKRERERERANESERDDKWKFVSATETPWDSNNQWQTETETPQSKVNKSKVKENKNISSKEDSEAEYWKPEINDLLEKIKKSCSKNWIIYDSEKDRMFAKHILTAKQFWEFCEKLWKDRCQVAVDVLNASVQIDFWKWYACWPMKIYKRHADIYNERLKKEKKEHEQGSVLSIPDEWVI